MRVRDTAQLLPLQGFSVGTQITEPPSDSGEATPGCSLVALTVIQPLGLMAAAHPVFPLGYYTCTVCRESPPISAWIPRELELSPDYLSIGVYGMPLWLEQGPAWAKPWAAFDLCLRHDIETGAPSDNPGYHFSPLVSGDQQLHYDSLYQQYGQSPLCHFVKACGNPRGLCLRPP